MNILQQTKAEFKRFPGLALISTAGTAIAVFMVLVIFINDNIGKSPTYPLSNADRIAVIPFIHHSLEKNAFSSYSMIRAGESSAPFYAGPLSYPLARTLSDSLPGVRYRSFIDLMGDTKSVASRGGMAHSLNIRHCDQAFWKICDFTFKSGDSRGSVITDRAARLLFGTEDVAGKEIMINDIPATISGVVKGANPLLPIVAGDLFLPYEPEPDPDDIRNRETSVLMLLDEDTDMEELRMEVERRHNRLNAADTLHTYFYHGAPFPPGTMTGVMASNLTPDPRSHTLRMLAVYAILLIIPAINLAAMTGARFRRMAEETGIRRACGATRLDIIFTLSGTSLATTCIGAAAGLAGAVVFSIFFSGFFFDLEDFRGTAELLRGVTPSLAMTLNAATILTTIAITFVLNIISTGIPAIRAAFANPAEAISTLRK